MEVGKMRPGRPKRGPSKRNEADSVAIGTVTGQGGPTMKAVTVTKRVTRNQTAKATVDAVQLTATTTSDPAQPPGPTEDTDRSDPSLTLDVESQASSISVHVLPFPTGPGSDAPLITLADTGNNSPGTPAPNSAEHNATCDDSASQPMGTEPPSPLPLPTPASAHAQVAVPAQEIAPGGKENNQYDSFSEESSVDGEYRPPVQAGNQDDDQGEGDSDEDDQLTSEPTMPKKGSKTSSKSKKAPVEASRSVTKGEKQRGKALKNHKKSHKTGTVSNTLELVPYVPADAGGVGSGDNDSEDLGDKDLTIPDEEAFRMARAAGVGQEVQFADDSLRSGWDWTKLQQCWMPRSGPPSNIAIEQIRSLTSQFAYHLYDIAAGSGLSQARAWQATGLLRHETRKPNVWNLWAAKEAEIMRAENGGDPLPGGKQATVEALSQRWDALSSDQRREIKVQLTREAEIEARNTAKEELATSDARQRYLEEFCRNTTDQMSSEMNRTGLVVVGFAVMPQDTGKNLAPLSMMFATHKVGVELWKKFGPHLSAMQDSLMNQLAGVNSVETNGWPQYRNNYEAKLKSMNRDELRKETAYHLRLMEVLTAPWEEEAREAEPMVLDGRFQWKSCTRLCRENDTVLVGWPSIKIWPGVTSMKALDAHQLTAVAKKLNKDRKPTGPIGLPLCYMAIGDLWLKVADTVSRIYDTAVEGATPLNELPFEERPTVVSHSGKILARVADDETEMERSHRERRNRAKLALESEDDANDPEESDRSDEEDEEGVLGAVALLGKNKGEKKRQRDSEDDSPEETNAHKRKKGKGKGRSKS